MKLYSLRYFFVNLRIFIYCNFTTISIALLNILIVLVAVFTLILARYSDPIVIVNEGVLKGKRSGDGTFHEFTGIPYATISNTSRFQAPQQLKPWKGIFSATQDISTCPQQQGSEVTGTELCLQLNVYVPINAAQKPFPVIVHFHGGAFVSGNGGRSVFGPEFLIRHDIILVTVNYRIGLLGFLCLGIREAPGNAGLKDQLAALKWVQRNIKHFGGDPDNVTALGQSAGAVSVSLMLASPTSDGLFAKAITQSGSGIANWAVNRDPIGAASLVASSLGYNTDDPKTLYNFFSQIPIEKLIAFDVKKSMGTFFDTHLLHLPCIEKVFPGTDPFLTEQPFRLFNQKHNNIPLMNGINSKEGLFFIARETTETLEEKNNMYLFSTDLEITPKTEANTITKIIKEFYFGNQIIGLSTKMNVSNLFHDLFFEAPALIESEIAVHNGNQNVFNYYFEYSGGRNRVKVNNGFGDVEGACHGDELLYLFNGTSWPYPISESDGKIINLMTKMWTNFAKFGDPTPDSEVDDSLVKWVPSSKHGLQFLWINNESRMGPIPNREAYYMWKNIYQKYRRL